MKKYKLLKPTFCHKAGTEAIYENPYYIMKLEDGSMNCFPKSYIEDNPDWFELVEEKETAMAKIINDLRK